jgi:hypothetical protein
LNAPRWFMLSRQRHQLPFVPADALIEVGKMGPQIGDRLARQHWQWLGDHQRCAPHLVGALG